MSRPACVTGLSLLCGGEGCEEEFEVRARDPCGGEIDAVPASHADVFLGSNEAWTGLAEGVAEE